MIWHPAVIGSRWWSAALLVAAASCSGGDDRAAADAQAQVDTLPNGRIRILNRERPQRSASGWRLEEDLRLGTLDGGGPAQFGRIGALSTDRSGRIFVLDLSGREIRVFNTDGSWVRTIGGPGSGPGEFLGPAGITHGPGDTLWVTDPVARRYTLFSPDGALIRTVPRSATTYADQWNGKVLRDGRLLDLVLSFPQEGPGVAGPEVLLYPVLVSGGAGVQDSFPPLRFGQELAVVGGVERPMPFFNGGLLVDADAQGALWFAHSRTYTIYRRSLEGDTTLEAHAWGGAQGVTEEDRAYVRRRLAARPEMLQGYLDALPRTKPLLEVLHVGGDGMIVVVARLEGTPQERVLDLFRPDGVLMARVPMPPAARTDPYRVPIVHAGKGFLLIGGEDAEGVPFVSRLRLSRVERQAVPDSSAD